MVIFLFRFNNKKCVWLVFQVLEPIASGIEEFKAATLQKFYLFVAHHTHQSYACKNSLPQCFYEPNLWKRLYSILGEVYQKVSRDCFLYFARDVGLRC